MNFYVALTGLCRVVVPFEGLKPFAIYAALSGLFDLYKQ